jgi:hypothetical protein
LVDAPSFLALYIGKHKKNFWKINDRPQENKCEAEVSFAQAVSSDSTKRISTQQEPKNKILKNRFKKSFTTQTLQA